MSPCQTCQQARQHARGLWGLIRSWLSIGIADEPLIQQRLNVCSTCDERLPCADDTTRPCKCEVCGCWLSHKTRLRSESCPLGKW